VLRSDEQDDIDQKAECRELQNANKNELEDIEHSIEKLSHAMQRMENTKGSLVRDIASLASGMQKTEKDIAELKEFRATTKSQFQKALSDDAEALSAMNSAITSLSKFFKDNFLQMHASGPEYTRDVDKAPGMSGANYGGRKSETTGIVGQLSMLAEDIEKEISEAKKDDADSQSEWELQNAALQETLDAQAETKAATEKETADLSERIAAANKNRSGKKNDGSAEEKIKRSIAEQCTWVDTHFDSRRQKRKVEIDGLADAKDFLAGGLR